MTSEYTFRVILRCQTPAVRRDVDLTLGLTRRLTGQLTLDLTLEAKEITL